MSTINDPVVKANVTPIAGRAGYQASDAGRSTVLESIKDKRAVVETYLTTASARRRRLLNLTIITGTAAAALTAAPALGGKSFADWLSSTFGLSSPSWQILCAVAAVCSLTATVATQLLKSNNLDDHISRAQDVRQQLEALEVGITSGQLHHTDAFNQYTKCIANVSFIHPK